MYLRRMMDTLIHNHDSKLAGHVFMTFDYLIIRETEMRSPFVSVNAHLLFKRLGNYQHKRFKVIQFA